MPEMVSVSQSAVSLNESIDDDIVTTTLVVPKHEKCENGKTITIKRLVDFKTLDCI